MTNARPRRRKRRFTRRWWWLAIVAVLAIAIVIDRSAQLLVGVPDDMAHYHGVNVQVSRVISGHTLEVAWPDEVEGSAFTHVRLWGLSAPLIASRTREAEPLSDNAVNLARELAESHHVTLRLESHRTRDTFNRILAHVELPTGSTLNEALLESGLARVDERWPHGMLTRYAQAEQVARRRGRGIWAD